MTTPISALLLNFSDIWSVSLLFYLTFTFALPITWLEIWLLRKLPVKKVRTDLQLSSKEVQHND